MSNLDSVQSQIKTLSAGDFESLLVWCLNMEKKRRENLPVIIAAQSEFAGELRKNGALPAVDVPEQPSAVTDFPAWQSPVENKTVVYAPGDMVAFDGKVWKSTYTGCNTAMPGSFEAGDAWVDVTAEVLADLVVDPGDDEETDEGLPETSPEGMATVAWQAGEPYTVGTLILYSGKKYRVVNAVPFATMPPDISPDYEEI